MRVALFLTFLLSCSSQLPVKQDSCGIEYLESKFYEEAVNNGTALLKRDIEFVFINKKSLNCGDSKTAIGCAGRDKIKFSKPYWESATCISREILFFHEMLHIFGKLHVAPPSIMQEYMLEDKEYLENRNKFLKEAFKF